MACLIGAYESQRYVHARELSGVRFEAEPTPDGRALVFSASDRLVRVEVTGDRTERSAPGVGAVLAVLDGERVIALGEPPGVFSLVTGERLLALDRAVTDADVRGDTAVVATSSGDVVFHDRESMGERARVSSSIRGRADVAATGPSSAVIGSTSQLFVEHVSVDGAPVRVELSGTLLELAASPQDRAVAAVQGGFGILLFAGGEPWSMAVPASVTSAAWIAPWRYAVAESDDRVVLRERVRALETLHPARGQGHRVVVAGASLVAIARPAPGPAERVRVPSGGRPRRRRAGARERRRGRGPRRRARSRGRGGRRRDLDRRGGSRPAERARLARAPPGEPGRAPSDRARERSDRLRAARRARGDRGAGRRAARALHPPRARCPTRRAASPSTRSARSSSPRTRAARWRACASTESGSIR
ncbi:MAG: hypothetical protein M5U28_43090 [Sandaracinaceae bacterium]|nr:hypothetical protein [Sandaracinaceae bacterium]